ncbi:SDR family NAD(P)-dependent oxidoreductase [uncultured Caballeronia sp.]|jgi:NAD(P)-dependent dehydrogenase (short-subunit alcohol dehydrogenase family)|uniref:SDR family NAD(P)-dependent oxidoreductase n=1 Tax=uncultured Caballeronia sp. TaxID=1827198 RepID=UPI0035CB4544
MDLGINGRIALITGADSGIGFSTAEQLLAEGAQVVITDKKSILTRRSGAKARSRCARVRGRPD